MGMFRSAASQFGVPEDLLLAVGYTESRWEPGNGSPSVDGGYGIMDLTARTFTPTSARGTSPARPVRLTKTHYTLDQAADLLHLSPSTLRSSEVQNIRGGAAVLASLARQLNGGHLPTTLAGWYSAVAAYSGDTQQQTAEMFANSVYSALRSGASLTTANGQHMMLPAQPDLQPATSSISRLGLQAQASQPAVPVDCPANLHCRFVPAAYAEDAPNQPGNYGDYDIASRPQDLTINSIVIHDTEGSYSDAIATFEDPHSYVSANYVISTTGQVTEMVRPQNVAWAVGDWYYNTHSISIEHEGFAADGSAWYTPKMYQVSAELVRYLAARFGVPLDRLHIIGHDNVPGPTDADTAAQHWDPGPFWNWNYYMSLVQGQGAPSTAPGRGQPHGHPVVVIDPNWSTNEPPVTDCSSGTCKPLPKQPANFVYLHTAPSAKAPLLSDPTLHPNGSPGTLEDNDWGDKAPAGEEYVLAARRGEWTGIWYGGQVGWFYNPPGPNRTAVYAKGQVITPRPGLADVPVYGSAFPEASAYPAGVPVQPNSPLVYKVPAGQEYVTTGTVPDDYYNAVTFNSSMPYDHTVISGRTLYYQIVFNHRLFYVKADDVMLKRAP
jgi:N-acetyl-anhydromuramyl-L-alanine amidase AmpD